MKQYLGVKLVQAEPCTQDEFSGGTLKKAGGVDQEGYRVKYADGYTSWCPKEQFEEANTLVPEGKNGLVEIAVVNMIRLMDNEQMGRLKAEIERRLAV